MFTQFGQKKKKEALRRLSQSAARRRSSEGKPSKNTSTPSQNVLFESSSLLKTPTGFVKPQQSMLETGCSQGIEKATNVAMFAVSTVTPTTTTNTVTVSMSSFGLPVSTNLPKFAFSVPSTSTAAYGFPVPTTSTTCAPPVGFPVGSVNTSVGFPVSSSSPPSFGFSSPSNISSKTFGFPVSSPKSSFGFAVPSQDTTSSISFPVSSTNTTTTSSFGFPVVSATSTSKSSSSSFGFPVSSSSSSGLTSFGFPVSSSQVGFPVSKTKSTSSFGFPVSTSSVGFPVTSSVTSSFGFPVSSSPVGFPVSTRSAGFPVSTSSAGFPVSTFKPLHRSPEGLTSFSTYTSSAGFPVSAPSAGFPVSTFKPSHRYPEDKATVHDISKLKSLVIREIPQACNKNAWLRRFYSRFGDIVKVLCNPGKASATVTFKTHEAAKLAKLKGKVLQKGLQPVNIFWKQERKRTTSGSKQNKELIKGKEASKQNLGEIQVRKVIDIESLPSAVSSGERYKILENIDSKIREGLTKSSDISTAKAVKGTCQDMCPEKERYMREDRRRLHLFESVPGTGSMEENPLIDHTKAVKEYDRSAADKEEPLPHELRPVKTLQMTMDYLATHIMDAGEGRWGDWFDFLWNRTRAIRKDITQQHLCDPGSVDLIEKIARFHIFCAHYLCDQDFGVFDPKINNENLTKCLQTLKHFYDDLYKNQNIVCPCEAEFRAYDILLNLNEGDILRQVMTYRPEVRCSPIVQFAMRVFNALNSNNSVRFFRLLRSSDYLCACLMHRYFTQVRQHAIRILNYSLSVPNKDMSYPLIDMTNLLAFEDEDEAAMFCRFHGLSVIEPNVVFVRGSFIEPESAFHSKSIVVVESKRTSSIGEVVYNGPLPPKPNHMPVSSFDESGNFIGDVNVLPKSPDVLAQNPLETLQTLSQETAAVKETPETAKPVLIDIEELKLVTKQLFLEVIDEMLVDVARRFYVEIENLRTLSTVISKDIEENCIIELLHDIAKTAIQEERQHKILEEENELCRENAASDMASDILKEVVDDESIKAATFVYNFEQEKQVNKSKDIATTQISQQLVDQTVVSEVHSIIQEVCAEIKSKRKESLQRLDQKVKIRRKDRYFKRWIKAYRSLVKLKKLLENFPAHSSFASPEQQLQVLVGQRLESQMFVPQHTRILEDASDIAETLFQRQAEIERIRSEILRPVDVPQLVFDMTRQTSVRELTPNSCTNWKLLVSLPKPCREIDSLMVDNAHVHVDLSILRGKFTRGNVTMETGLSGKLETLSLYNAEMSSGLSVTNRCRICTLAFYGLPTNNEVTELQTSRQLQGTNALLIVVESSELQTHSARKELQARAQRLLQSKPRTPVIPVLVLYLEDQATDITQESIIEATGIGRLTEHVSSITVSRLPTIIQIQTMNDMLMNSVEWLLQNSQNKLNLETSSLTSFIEEGIQSYFYRHFYEDLTTRKNIGLAEQDPVALVSLYNAALDKLASVVTSHSLGHVSWPAQEFCEAENCDFEWNSEPSLSSLNSVISSLSLPDIPVDPTKIPCEKEVELCRLYVSNIPQRSTYLTQRVEGFLRRSGSTVPWSQIIEASISCILSSLYSDPFLSQTNVYFFVNELEGFCLPNRWTNAIATTKDLELKAFQKDRSQLSSQSQSKDSLIQDSVKRIDENLDSILRNSERSKRICLQRKTETASLRHSIDELRGRLGAALTEARDDIISFENDLKNWIPENQAGFSKKRKADFSKKSFRKSSRQSPVEDF